MSFDGSDYIVGQDYGAQDANEDKNHYRNADPLNNFANLQPGMIVSKSADDKLFHIISQSPGFDEILQENFSIDKEPKFTGIDLWSGVYHHIIRASQAEGLAGADLRIGLDESLRNLIICDRGDIGTDFGMVAQSGPSIAMFSADGSYHHIISSSQAEGLAGADLRIGLDESLRTLIICDRGDIDVDFGLIAQTDPSFTIFSSDHTRLGKMSIGTSFQFLISGVASNMVFTGNRRIFFQMIADTVNGDEFIFRTSPNTFGLTDTNAEQAWMSIEPVIKQSNTAGYIGLRVDVIETTLGDGSAGAGYNALMDLRVSGVTQFGIQNDGKIMTNQTAAATTPGNVTDRLPIYDGTGTLVGYIAIYDNIT